MELNFSTVGTNYVAEFKADGPFSLHLELPEVGHLRVRQKSVEAGAYTDVDDMPIADQFKPVVDRQFTGEVWPIWMQIEVGARPTMAVVTFA